MFSPLALVRLHLKCCVEYWTPEYQTNVGILEQALRGATNMMKRLEHLPYAQRLREMGLFILKEII